MLLLSITLIALTFGLTFIFLLAYIFFIAIRSNCDGLRIDSIVILGKKLVNNQPDRDYRLRLDRALTIAAHRDDIRIYILGGITRESIISESSAGRNYLESNGIKSIHIFIEEESRDTLDNMKHLKTNALIKKSHVAIITNRYHLARASIMAEGFGFNVIGCAAEDSFVPDITEIVTLISEAFFLHWYLCGRSYANIIHNKRILSRIQ